MGEIDPNEFLLDFSRFQILLLLYEQPRHGYNILTEFKNRIGKEISPSIDNIKYFKDLFEIYPDYWKQRENFKLDSFKNKFFIKFFTIMANLVLGNY